MMAGGRLWEPEEEALVRECEPTAAGYAALARKLGRTAVAVKIRRYRFNPNPRPLRKWTPEEDALVRRYVGHRDAARAVATALNRPSNEIWRRARLIDGR